MDRETTKAATRFAKKIRAAYKPEKIILFGSRARGDNLKTSDYDYVIVSKAFENTRFLDRIPPIYEYWDEPVDIEPICYTPAEFERKKKEHGTIRSALEEGVEL